MYNSAMFFILESFNYSCDTSLLLKDVRTSTWAVQNGEGKAIVEKTQNGWQTIANELAINVVSWW